jgi:Na+-translocating ferredoxin:NAD+ oxidoreductase RNF subunit RnfB
MGIFITIKHNLEKCKEGCFKCVQSCPVDIFEKAEKKVKVIENNEDECTICDLCLQVCPVHAIRIEKNYI